MRNQSPCLGGALGLRNLGNTCYINASLQALAHCQPFVKYFTMCHGHMEIPRKNPLSLSAELAYVVQQLWRPGHANNDRPIKSLRPLHFIDAVDQEAGDLFYTYEQQDAEEFLQFLLDRLDAELALPTLEDDVSLHTHGEDAKQRDAVAPTTAQPGTQIGPGGDPTGDRSSSLRVARDETPPPAATRVVVKHTNQSIVDDVLQASNVTRTTCLRCGTVSSRSCGMRMLQLALPTAATRQRDKSKGVASSSVGSRTWAAVNDTSVCRWLWQAWDIVVGVLPVSQVLEAAAFTGDNDVSTLEQCMRMHFMAETMSGDNQYHCEKCGGKADAKIEEVLADVPKVLMITLKRFKYSLRRARKLQQHVAFPFEMLDMAPFVDSKGTSPAECAYHLCSVICHVGNVGGGHYYAYGRSPVDDRWYCYDDASVTQVDATEVAACQAYILFYQRGRTRQDVKTATETYVHRMLLPGSPRAETARHSNCHNVTLVSTRWLAKARSVIDPGPVDNSDFVCQHGRYLPHRVHALADLASEVPLDVAQAWASRFGENAAAVLTERVVCPCCKVQLEKLNERRLNELEAFSRGGTQVVDGESSASEESDTVAYAVGKVWFDDWKWFVRSTTMEDKPPGPINNKFLLTSAKKPGGPEVRRNLLHGADYELLTRREWEWLVQCYGGGPAVEQRPVGVGANMEYTWHVVSDQTRDDIPSEPSRPRHAFSSAPTSPHGRIQDDSAVDYSGMGMRRRPHRGSGRELLGFNRLGERRRRTLSGRM
eukprot:m.97948 g.97948  ORF g.97948 m.97948 type:complete len:765 (+) comp16733_c1_seq8:244-2538(+)